jgi:hypothetical protein
VHDLALLLQCLSTRNYLHAMLPNPKVNKRNEHCLDGPTRPP